MMSVEQFNTQLECGAWAWPGGYPLFFLTFDGCALSFEAARDNAELIRESIANGDRDGWRAIACQVNWEDAELHCAHTGKRIESAYAEDESDSAD